MAEKVNPSINRPAEAFKTAGAITYGGSGGGDYQGFVVDGASPTEIATQDGAIAEANLNTFSQTSGGASLNVDIAPGEAFVYGAWLAIDTTTTVSLTASTANQTVYVGWNKDSSDDVIIGKSSAFASASGDTDLKIPLFDFDTDGSGVTGVTDRRRVGYGVNIEDSVYFNNGAVEVTFNGTNVEVIGSGLEVAQQVIVGGDITDGTNVVYDFSAGHVPAAQVQPVFLRSDQADSFSGAITGNAELNLDTTNGRLVLPVGVDQWAT